MNSRLSPCTRQHDHFANALDDGLSGDAEWGNSGAQAAFGKFHRLVDAV